MQPDELVSADIPTTGVSKRPKRLVVITIMNIAIALMSIVLLVFLLNSSKVPTEVVPSHWSAAFSALLAIGVIVSSVLALLGSPRARRQECFLTLSGPSHETCNPGTGSIDPRSRAKSCLRTIEIVGL
jgi:hypothetical protein